MADGGIRGGVPREIIIDGVEYEPAEGSELTYHLAGYNGPSHLAGNRVHYKESNPHDGGFSQDISVSAAKFKTLSALQTSGRYVTVTLTDAGNNVFSGSLTISNDGALENANGVVSLEMGGGLEPR